MDIQSLIHRKKKQWISYGSLFFLIFTGCHPHYLKVRSEALFPSYLASERVETPDPNRSCFFGQQIVIRWNLPARCLKHNDIKIILTLRYGNLSGETFSFCPCSCWGFWTVPLLNQEYWEKGGILSFKVELFKENILMERWQHHVWAEIIEL